MVLTNFKGEKRQDKDGNSRVIRISLMPKNNKKWAKNFSEI